MQIKSPRRAIFLLGEPLPALLYGVLCFGSAKLPKLARRTYSSYLPPATIRCGSIASPHKGGRRDMVGRWRWLLGSPTQLVAVGEAEASVARRLSVAVSTIAARLPNARENREPITEILYTLADTNKPLILNIFHNCHAKLPETNYQKPVKLQIRCKGTTKIAHTQIFGTFFATIE